MKWLLNTKKTDFEAIRKKYQISPMLAKLLCNRDIADEKHIDFFLNGTVSQMHKPGLLKDMKKAVELLISYVREGRHIRIIGDYDIDGICSSYILQKGLSFIKGDTKGIDIRIPHRVTDGYGLNERLIDEAISDDVELLITCDNGIAAYDQIARAKEAGIAVVVTDHHEVPYEETENGISYIVPLADAVINPKQADCTYPYRDICGGVVAYKVVEALMEYIKKETENASDFLIDEMLQECFAFAAFATIGDTMDLVDENHLIVKYGLKAIENCSNIGLQALIRACDLQDKEITVYHIGFVMGPCFNASGRLDDAYHVIELLNATSKKEADMLAAKLRMLNKERQELTIEGEQAAYEAVENQDLLKDKVLVVCLENVHESLAGIIAGRLCKKYYRPVFVLTQGENGLKGSGRSIEAYDMFCEMTKVKDVFLKYGGHKMAAGLSMASDKAEEFRKRINEVCTLTEGDLEETLMLDMHLPLEYANYSFVTELSRLEPYGNGNPKPLFAERVSVSNVRILGAMSNTVRFQMTNEAHCTAVGLYFCDGNEFMEGYKKSKDKRAKIAYTPEFNTYNGNTTIQMKIRYLEWYA